MPPVPLCEASADNGLSLPAEAPPGPRRWWAHALLVFGVFTVIGLLDAHQTWVHYTARGENVTVLQVVCMGLGLWYGWALLAPAVFFLGDRFPPEDSPRWRNLGVHVVGCVACVFVKILLDYPVIEMFYCPEPGLMPLTKFYGMALRSQFHTYLFVYWAMLGVQRALAYRRRCRERELQAARLQALLTQAQLQMLRMQLNPHFLFNTLNTISALVQRDANTAERMIARLGDLLRLSLENAGRHEAALKEEVEFLQAYLEIEQARYGDRLRVAFDVDPDALDVPVPYLVLQPLVENAVKHGIAPRRRGGRLEVRARLEGGSLCLEVIDDGPGMPEGRPANGRQGIGLANTRARLEHLFGGAHSFELRAPEGGGLCVAIRVPARRAEVGEAAGWKAGPGTWSPWRLAVEPKGAESS